MNEHAHIVIHNLTLIILKLKTTLYFKENNNAINNNKNHIKF